MGDWGGRGDPHKYEGRHGQDKGAVPIQNWHGMVPDARPGLPPKLADKPLRDARPKGKK